MDLEEVEELALFLAGNRADIRAEACKHVKDLTGTESGISTLLLCSNDVCTLLLRLLGDVESVSTNATKALVNLTTHPRARLTLVTKQSFWSSILETALAVGKDHNTDHAKVCLMLLNNMTTSEEGAKRLMTGRLGEEYMGHDVQQLLEKFLNKKADDDSEYLNRILPVVTNVTQIQEGRDLLLSKHDSNEGYFRRILFCTTSNNEKTRKAAVEIVRNCCFSKPHHRSLVVNTLLVERLLIPLIGGEKLEDVDEEDLEGIPEVMKQYLESEDIEREANADIRRSVIDAIYLLTQTRSGREALRSKKAYEVIKVYHCDEEEESISEEVFKIVDRILADEDPDEKEEYEESLRITDALNAAPMTIPGSEAQANDSEHEDEEDLDENEEDLDESPENEVEKDDEAYDID